MLGILELNINRFKIINESLGHDAGDALLKQVSKRLIHAVHENDTVVRLGGDEFIVVLENIDRMEDVVWHREPDDENRNRTAPAFRT